MSSRTVRRRVRRIRLPDDSGDPQLTERSDLLAAEEPLGIRVAGQALTMTMRTPGDDVDLAAGFLVSEGIVRHPDDIASIRLCDGTTCGHAGHDGIGNIVDVELRPGLAIRPSSRRNFMTTSACGVCGKASTAELFVQQTWEINQDHASIPAAMLTSMPGALRAAQRVFASTGGLHAAGVFGPDGQLIAIREDVGRHNAVDKVVGWAFRLGMLPMRGCVLLVSGRASFELVQKAVLAGFPVLAAVSAPSSLAADLASEAGLTLVGFLRGGSMNVYTRSDRVLAETVAASQADGVPGRPRAR
ncbi:MAG: formate dehydrogenase accessory sulfurtransferase FdhD [Streptosporangiaceae bacterium]